MPTARVTRGRGALEGLLARKRAAMADRLIPAELRRGRVLDIGCGSRPYFLTQTDFTERHGVDKMLSPDRVHPAEPDERGLRLVHHNIDTADRLPFADEYFDAVTMLAVFEHIRPARLVALLDEVHRVLKTGGVYVMTTPAGWTGPILAAMKMLRLVSAEEIDEHEDSYSRDKVRAVVARTRLASCEHRLGCFECGMNTWMTIRKGPGPSA